MTLEELIAWHQQHFRRAVQNIENYQRAKNPTNAMRTQNRASLKNAKLHGGAVSLLKGLQK